MLTVCTYLWSDPTRANRGYTFNEGHVRVLRNMVKRNLKIPHRFVCVTDLVKERIEGMDDDPDFIYHPMDWSTHVPGTVYARLQHQDKEIGGRICGGTPGPLLSLDLDIVIVADIDPLLRRSNGRNWMCWRNPNWGGPRRAYYQSSIQLLIPGARQQLYDDFDPETTPKWVNMRFGGAEQAWFSERLGWDEAVFTEEDGIYGAGRIGDWGDNQVVDELPQNACIISFPGAREPSQPEVQAKHSWISEHYR